jgi:hypothetical protein
MKYGPFPMSVSRRRPIRLYCRYRLSLSPAVAEIVGDGRPWTVLMISLLSILELDAGDAEVGVTELALDHDERNAFVRHLDRVRVPQLVGRKATSDAGCGGRVM